MIVVYYDADGTIFMTGQGTEEQIKADGKSYLAVADPALDYCNDYRVADGSVVRKDAPV